jgi:hypothetical protein
MTTHTLRALLWKDYRLVRTLLLGGLGLIVLFAIAPIIAAALRADQWTDTRFFWAADFCTMLCFLVSGLLVASTGAALPTHERADRSSAFLAALPPSRGANAASKTIVGLGAVALVVALDTGLIATLDKLHPPGGPVRTDEWAYSFAGTWAMMFCGAWLAGWLVASPAIATVIGIGMPIILFMAAALTIPDLPNCLPLYWDGCLVFGAVFFFLGGAIALRRRY